MSSPTAVDGSTTPSAVYSIVHDENLSAFVKATLNLTLSTRRCFGLSNWFFATGILLSMLTPLRSADPNTFWVLRVESNELPFAILCTPILAGLLVVVIMVFVVLLLQVNAAARLALHSGAFDSRAVLPAEALGWTPKQAKHAFVETALTNPTLLGQNQAKRHAKRVLEDVNEAFGFLGAGKSTRALSVSDAGTPTDGGPLASQQPTDRVLPFRAEQDAT